ncbi:MAG: DUF3243 domain-containing protein [Halanaerobiales bacterium]
MVDRFEDWNRWKRTIAQAVDLGEKLGMEEDTIVGLGTKIGDFLDKRADPENREQRVIKEMWDMADEEEQKSLTRLLVRMVDKEFEEKT